MKQKIREVIVVEGRYDKNTLLQVRSLLKLMKKSGLLVIL